MKNLGLTLAFLASHSATVAASCDVDTFSSILSSIGATPSASVVYATPIAEGGSSFDPSPPFPQANSLPELCAVKIEVQSSENSSYRFGVFLPTDWNERMMTTGNGGFGGGINYPDMAHLSRYGFASISTDTGHLSASPDGSWALNAPESIIDWGWRAMHGSVTLSKQLITAYYDTPIRYSYYAGCSTGGRQGLKEMQISPDSFDGILAGAPAWWTTHLQSWTTWYPLQNYPVDSPAHIPASSFPAIAAAIDAQCDPQDGVRDNITQNPFSCAVDWPALNLTAPQLTTLQRLHSNWTSSNSSLLFPSHPPGTLLALADPTAPNPLGYTFFSYFVYNDASYNFTRFTETDLAAADAANPGAANADDFAAIERFRDRGGKLIVYHGLADPAIPVGSSVVYWERTVGALGEGEGKENGKGGGAANVDVDDFFRLFLVPNMGHCSGSAPDPLGDSPWYFGGASQRAGNVTVGPEGLVGGAAEGGEVKVQRVRVPGTAEEARVDAILALVRWVEGDGEGDGAGGEGGAAPGVGGGGAAPDELVVRKFRGDNLTDAEVVRTGKICAWPRQASWDGIGDVAEEKSWSCGV